MYQIHCDLLPSGRYLIVTPINNLLTLTLRSRATVAHILYITLSEWYPVSYIIYLNTKITIERMECNS